MKRLLSLLLVAFMVISTFAVMPTTVVASGPVGTAVSTEGEFSAMTAGGQYYLTADITVSATYSGEFTGTFDGNGKTITTSVPLFETVSGTIKNLTTDGAIDFALVPDHAGAVAKVANNATFNNVTNKASVAGYTTTYLDGEILYMGTAGGVVGTAKGNCTFANVSNEGAINGYNTGGIAGIVGFTADGSTSFEFCSNSGALTANNTNIVGTTDDPLRLYLKSGNYLGVGGIVGLIYEQGNVDFVDCSNSGSIDTSMITNTDSSPYAPAGGIFGVATYVDGLTPAPAMSVTLNNCSNTAAIKGIRQTGGLVGWAGNATLVANNCTNSGTVESTTSYAGGLIGRNSEISIFMANCTNEATGIVTANVSHVAGIIGYSVPTLSLEMISCTNYADLSANMAGSVNVAGIIGSNGNNTKYKFSLINCRNEGNMNAVGTGTSPNGQAAGLVANCGAVAYASFINCVNTGNISSTQSAGGIVAQRNANPGLLMKDCINEGNVTNASGNTGGIIGYMTQTDSTFINCINRGNISSTDIGAVGGISGRVSQCAEYYNCINFGNITNVNAVAGGIAGYNGGSGTYITPQIFDSCGNEGNVSSYKEYVGGIIGYCYGNADRKVEVRNSYVLGTMTSNTKYVSGLVGYINTINDLSIEYNYINATFVPATGLFSYAVIYNNNAVGDASSEIHDNYIVSGTADYLRFKQVPKVVEPEVPGDPNIAFPVDYAYYYETADLATGKLANTINTAAGKDVFFQDLGVDTHPTTMKSHHAVRLVGTEYLNILKASFTNGLDTFYADYASGENFTAPTATDVLYWAYSSDILIPGAEYSSSTDMNYTSVTVSLETREEASVRMTTGSTGLRFYTDIDKESFDTAKAGLTATYTVSYGTIITPKSYVNEAGKFTLEALDALTKTSEKYLIVASAEPFETNDSAYTVTGSIANLDATVGKDDHRDLDFAAIGYICITDTVSGATNYIYSDSYSVRNVSSIATAALNDVVDIATVDYPYIIEGGIHDTKFSPYTNAERAIIDTLVVAVIG